MALECKEPTFLTGSFGVWPTAVGLEGCGLLGLGSGAA